MSSHLYILTYMLAELVVLLKNFLIPCGNLLLYFNVSGSRSSFFYQAEIPIAEIKSDLKKNQFE